MIFKNIFKSITTKSDRVPELRVSGNWILAPIINATSIWHLHGKEKLGFSNKISSGTLSTLIGAPLSQQ